MFALEPPVTLHAAVGCEATARRRFALPGARANDDQLDGSFVARRRSELGEAGAEHFGGGVRRARHRLAIARPPRIATELVDVTSGARAATPRGQARARRERLYVECPTGTGAPPGRYLSEKFGEPYDRYLAQKEGGKVVYKSAEALELIERVMKATGGELECHAIVGRRFEGLADHAAWLREGGCAKILDALARVRPESPDVPLAAPAAVILDGVGLDRDEGRQAALDPDGHLADRKQWTRAVGERIATALAVDMGEAHWRLIEVARADFEKNGAAPNVRRLTQVAGVSTKELYALFPHAPARTIAKIAGLPKPAGCV